MTKEELEVVERVRRMHGNVHDVVELVALIDRLVAIEEKAVLVCSDAVYIPYDSLEREHRGHYKVPSVLMSKLRAALEAKP